MRVEFVVGSLLCSERFFSRYSSFPLSTKTNISKFQFNLDATHFSHEPLAHLIAQALPVFDVKFTFTCFYYSKPVVMPESFEMLETKNGIHGYPISMIMQLSTAGATNKKHSFLSCVCMGLLCSSFKVWQQAGQRSRLKCTRPKIYATHLELD